MKYLTALALAALAPLAMAQTTATSSLGKSKEIVAPIASLAITEVEPAFAMHPGLLLIRGHGLHKAVHVTVAGEPALILESSEDALRVFLAEGVPGFPEVVVYTQHELARADMMMYPAIRVGISDAFWSQVRSPDTPPHALPLMEPGVFALRINNGCSGWYFLGACLNMNPQPGTWPSIGHEWYLAPTYQTLSLGTIPETGIVRAQLAWPAQLTGLPLHFQGFAVQELPGGDELCFTNMCTVAW